MNEFGESDGSAPAVHPRRSGRSALASGVTDALREVERAMALPVSGGPAFRDLRVRITERTPTTAFVSLRLAVAYGVVLPVATRAIGARIREQLRQRFSVDEVVLVIEYEDLYFQRT